MRWPSRQSPAVVPAPGEPATAPAAARESVWVCAGLRELLAAAARRSCRGLVELGPISAPAFSLYSRLTPGIHVVDLLTDALGAPASAGLVPAAAATRVLERLPDHSQSLALGWECLDYLAPTAAAEVIADLARALHPGARLHLLAATSGGLPPRPRRFIPEEDGRVRILEGEGDGVPGGRDLAPAELERRIRPFRVEHSVLLRDGVREVVATLP